MQSEGYLSSKEWDDIQLRLRNAKLELDQARYNLSDPDHGSSPFNLMAQIGLLI